MTTSNCRFESNDKPFDYEPCAPVAPMPVPFKHVHAELMALFAQDAAETATPWLRWQVRGDNSGMWMDANTNFYFHHNNQYRRKVMTIRIGDVDVPEPLRKVPKDDDRLYAVDLVAVSSALSIVWNGENKHHQRYLRQGLLHADYASCKAHTCALIKLSELPKP